MKKPNQFIKFNPVLKEKIWGGTKLMKFLNKNSQKKNIGESWEVSDVEGDISVVVNGDLKGKSLKEIINLYKSKLIGEKVYQKFGNKFPLLIKFIDANTPLSIQLHPDDELAGERHNSFGKTEMWYIVQADENANLVVGFKKDSNKEEYLKHLENKTLPEILNTDEVTEGDAYFIPAGRIHAVGAGVLLAEIQQTSDITYRIYDWDRRDSKGNYRELHTGSALDAIDFKSQVKYSIHYNKKVNDSSTIVSCPYFTTNILSVQGILKIRHDDKDSFVIYMCVSGQATFSLKNEKDTVKIGETLLVPACIKEFTISSVAESELLEIFIPAINE